MTRLTRRQTRRGAAGRVRLAGSTGASDGWHGDPRDHDADVADAPTFAQVAPAVVAALANRVVCSHNVYFDVSFLGGELERCGYPFEMPHLCTMLLPRALDAAIPQLSLARACERWSITHGGAHAAVHDATAAAKLLREHLRTLRKRSLRTFEELKRASSGEYKFFQSFERPLIPAPATIHGGKLLRPRGARPATGRKANIAEYLEALLDAAADLRLADAERTELRALPSRLALREDEIRAVHAKIFWGMLGRFVEDARVDLREVAHLRAMRGLLGELGWAPGDAAMSLGTARGEPVAG